MDSAVDLMRSVVEHAVDPSWSFRSVSPNSVWHGLPRWSGFIATHLDGRDIEVWSGHDELWLILADRRDSYAVEISGVSDPVLVDLTARLAAGSYRIVSPLLRRAWLEVTLGGSLRVSLKWIGVSRHNGRRRSGVGPRAGWDVAHRVAREGAPGGLAVYFRTCWGGKRPRSLVHGSVSLKGDEGFPSPIPAMESDMVGRVLLRTLAVQCGRRYRDVATVWLSNPGEIAPVTMACVSPFEPGRFPVTVIWGITSFRVLVGTSVWEVPIVPGWEFESIGETIALIDEVIDRGVTEFTWMRGAIRVSYLGDSRPPAIIGRIARAETSSPYR